MKIFLQIAVVFLILQTASVCIAVGATTVAVSAVVLSKSNCKFNSAATALAFGSLELANPIDRTVNATISFRCGGAAPNATFFISDNDGLYETGPNANRMRHTTVPTEYLPYSFALNPASGTVPKNSNQTLTISGTVRGLDYQNASIGTYSDTVIISIEP